MTIIGLVIAFFLLTPILGISAHLNLENFRSLIESESFWKALHVTLLSGAGAAILSTIIGLGWALPFSRWEWRYKRLFKLVLLIPYLIPNFILAMGFVTTWNPASGLLNKIVPFPFGLYGMWGMISLFTISHCPIAFLLIEEKLKRMDNSLREAAQISGASATRIFLNVELPLLVPSILSAFIISFSLNISAFAIPAWIGAPARTYPLTYKVFQAIQMGGVESFPEAAALCVVLFVLACIPIFLSNRLQGNEKKYVFLSGKSNKLMSNRPSKSSFIAFALCFWAYQIFVWITPITNLTLTTLVKAGCLQAEGLVCLQQITLEKYTYILFGLSETKAALQGSLIYGSFASLIITLLAIIAVMNRGKGYFERVFEAIINLPLATPGAVIALGTIIVYSGKFGINLYNTAWIVVLAFVIKHLSLGYQPLKTGFMNLSTSLVESAQLCGAGFFGTWRKIVLPILKPELLGGVFLVFIPIVGELTMSIFLTSPNFKNIGTVLFDLQDYADQGAASALAILLIIMILLLNQMARTLSRGKLGY